MLSSVGWNAHGSFEFTPPSNCTVTVRALRASPAAAVPAWPGPCSRRMPNTFSQAIRYSGTRAKVKANAASATPASFSQPALRLAGAWSWLMR